MFGLNQCGISFALVRKALDGIEFDILQWFVDYKENEA